MTLVRTAFPALACALALGWVGSTTRQAAARREELDRPRLEELAAEIRGEIERLRESEFRSPVAVELADVATFRAYVTERMERSDSPQALAAQADTARLLGLVPAGLDLQAELQRLLESQVGGFYDPQTDTFYLMEGFDGDLARFILAHELVHALDDQLFDIDGTLERVGGSSDADFAFHAVVEGSATQTGMAWAMKHMRSGLDVADLGDAGLQLPPLDAPPFLWKPLLASYMRGLAFVERGRKLHGEDFLQRVFEHPPRSSEQVLHPEKYWKDSQRDEPRELEFLPTDSGAAEGWSVLHEDTLGELGLALVVEPREAREPLDPQNAFALLALVYSGSATNGWGGDRALLLGKGEERFLRLASVWDSEEDAREFAAALQAVMPPAEEGVTWTLRGPAEAREGEARDVVVLDARTSGASALTPPAWRELPRPADR